MSLHPVLDALLASGLMNDDDIKFLIEYGRSFEPTTLPRKIKLQPPGACFTVSRELARRGLGAYARGFAIHPEYPKVLAHGWVSQYGAAIDASWPYSADTRYWGVTKKGHEERLRGMSKPFVRRDMFFKLAL